MEFSEIVRYHRELTYLKGIIERKYNVEEHNYYTAIKTGNVYMFEFVYKKHMYKKTKLEDNNIITQACIFANLEIIKWIHYNTYMSFTDSCVDNCMFFQSIETIEWLIKNTLTRPTKQSSNIAAQMGRIEILEYLHKNGYSFGASTMNRAAIFNQIGALKWLNENRTEGCTEVAMDMAAGRGYFNVIQYLHYNTKATCTSQAIDKAAENGYLEIVHFLFTRRNEGCTSWAIDSAARNGHIDVVRWLYTNTDKRPFEFLDECLAEQGLTEMIDFMYNNGLIKLTLDTVYVAIEFEQWDTVRYLKGNAELMELVYTYCRRPEIIRIINELK